MTKKSDMRFAGSSEAESQASSHSTSLLVRFWLEPRESSEGKPVLRGYFRNLRTGEEAYIQHPKNLEEHILRQLESEHKRSLSSEVSDTKKASG